MLHYFQSFRRTLIASTAIISVLTATPVMAQDNADFSNAFVGFLVERALAESKPEIISMLLFMGLIDRSSAAYFSGILQAQSGDLDAAIDFMKMSVRFNDRALAPRYALTDYYIADYRYVSAEKQADILKTIPMDPGSAEKVGELISQIPPKNDFSYTGWFVLRPSTNINHGTYETEVESNFGTGVISEDSRQKSGVGLEAGISLENSRILADHFDLVTRADVYTVQYLNEEHTISRGDYSHEYGMDAYGGRVELALRRRHYEGSFEVAAFAGAHSTDAGRIVKNRGEDAYYARADSQNYGFALRGEYNIARDLRLRGNFTQDVRDYLDEGYEYANGSTSSIRLSAQKAVDEKSSFIVSFGVNDHDETYAHNSYTETELGFDFYRQIREDWVIGTGYNYSTLTEKAPQLFQTDATWVNTNTFSLMVQNNAWEIYETVPRVRCSYNDAQSNDAFARYSSFDCGLEFAKEF